MAQIMSGECTVRDIASVVAGGSGANFRPTVASVQNHSTFLPTTHGRKISRIFYSSPERRWKILSIFYRRPTDDKWVAIFVSTVASVENHMNFLPTTHGRKISRKFSASPERRCKILSIFYRRPTDEKYFAKYRAHRSVGRKAY